MIWAASGVAFGATVLIVLAVVYAFSAGNLPVAERLTRLWRPPSATAQVAQENVQLKSEVTTTEKRMDALEEEFRKAQTEAPFTAPATPSVKGTNDW